MSAGNVIPMKKEHSFIFEQSADASDVWDGRGDGEGRKFQNKALLGWLRNAINHDVAVTEETSRVAVTARTVRITVVMVEE